MLSHVFFEAILFKPSDTKIFQQLQCHSPFFRSLTSANGSIEGDDITLKPGEQRIEMSRCRLFFWLIRGGI